MYKVDVLPPFVYFPRVFWSMNRVFRITTTYILFSGTRWKPCAALASNILGNYEGNHCVWLPYEQHFYWRGRDTKNFHFFFTNVVYRLLQAHWILMSSSSRLVLEVRSHIIMSSNFTLLLGFLYAFSAKKILKTWCVCVNIFNFSHTFRGFFLEFEFWSLFFGSKNKLLPWFWRWKMEMINLLTPKYASVMYTVTILLFVNFSG